MCAPVQQEERAGRSGRPSTISLRKEHTIGREGVLARVETKVALKRAPALRSFLSDHVDH